MPLYKTLKQTNEAYDPGLLSELDDLFVGGYQIASKAGKYLTQLVGEHDARFQERCNVVAYQPYFGQIVSQFASALFAQPLDVKPAADASNPDTPGELPDPQLYRDFAKDCDRKGGSFQDLMKAALITALTKRSAIVHLDAPAVDEVPTTKLEEEALGSNRVYAYEVPLEQLIDWAEDKNGLTWAVLHWIENPRNGPFGNRDTNYEHFKVWYLEDGVAVWQEFVASYPVNGPPPNDDQEIPASGGGKTSFKRIPLLKLTLPIGLWVGNLIGPSAREHYQRRSSLIGSQNRSLCAIPWVSRGPEIGAEGSAMPSTTQENPYRGADPVGTFNKKGFVEIGSDDKIGFAEPLGHCYEIIDKELGGLKDAMFSVASQMAASISGSSTTALGRSGLSKQKDTESTSKVLAELGSKIRTFAALIYRTISEARNEVVMWTPHGLDDYEQEDREQVLEEGVSLDQIAIPSITFRRHHKYQTARKLLGPGVDPTTLDQIKTEIEAGVAQEEEMRSLMAEAQKDAIENPPIAGGAAPAAQDSPLAPQNPTVLGMKTPATPPGGTPQPGGATKDGKIGQSKAIKMAGTPSEAPGAEMSTTARAIGESGQPVLPANAHHQSGAHVDAQTIYDMLVDDYKRKDIEWVLNVAWVGPAEVQLDSIDFSGVNNWAASDDTEHVQDFVDIIRDGGQLKPAVLISNPSNDDKFLVCDGHHRALASLQEGVPLVAYVGQVGSNQGPWSDMHDSQRGGSKQKSSQQSDQKSKQRSSQQK
jgi:hypothetical protein